MTIKNLTPHAVNIVDSEGNLRRSFASEGIARATQSSTVVGEVDGIELVEMSFGDPIDLPDPTEGTLLIVSVITANAAKACGRGADDLVIAADPVRDSEGRIIGCMRLAKV